MNIISDNNGIKQAVYNRALLDQKQGSVISEEELKEFEKEIRQEQNRVNVDAIQWAYSRLMGINSVLTEINREIEEGNNLIFQAMELYSKGLSGKQLKKAKKKDQILEDYFPGLNIIVFPDHTLIIVNDAIKENLELMENNEKENQWN